MNKKIKLSFRLQVIANKIKKTSVVADVGCDHGKLLAHLLSEQKAQFVFASDISAPSVSKAERLIREKGFNNFKALESDGFLNYTKNEKNIINTVVVAGMGGLEIIKILTPPFTNTTEFSSLKTLVLQPQNNAPKLREFLLKNNFLIEFDAKIKEKHMFYDVIVVNFRKTGVLTKQEITWGKSNLKFYNPYFISFLENEINKINAIINSVSAEKITKFENEKTQLLKLFEKIQKMKTDKNRLLTF